jgi:hypothetical protein
VDSFQNYILDEDDLDFLKDKINNLWNDAIPFNDNEIPDRHQSRLITLYDAAKILFKK